MTTLPCPDNESTSRLVLLKRIFAGSPGKHEQLHLLHAEIEKGDPRFYAQLAAWYCDHGAAAVHREIFLARLILCDCPPRRDIGLALLRRLSPRQVAGVLDYIHGRKKTRTITRCAAPTKPSLATRLTRWIKPPASSTPESMMQTKSFGLFRNPPRSLRTEIARYLRDREADADWFDLSVMEAPKAMKRLYALNHVKPSERAQRVLFDRNPPPGSRLFARRQLAKARTPAEQLRAIVDLAIPYQLAASVLTRMNPTVLCALIEKMTPGELNRQMPCLKRQGVLENAYLKGRIDRKLENFLPVECDVVSVAREPNDIDLLTEIETYPIPKRAPIHL